MSTENLPKNSGSSQTESQNESGDNQKELFIPNNSMKIQEKSSSPREKYPKPAKRSHHQIDDKHSPSKTHDLIENDSNSRVNKISNHNSEKVQSANELIQKDAASFSSEPVAVTNSNSSDNKLLLKLESNVKEQEEKEEQEECENGKHGTEKLEIKADVKSKSIFFSDYKKDGSFQTQIGAFCKAFNCSYPLNRSPPLTEEYLRRIVAEKSDILDVSDILIYQSYPDCDSLNRKIPELYDIEMIDSITAFILLYKFYEQTFEETSGQNMRSQAIQKTSEVLAKCGIECSNTVKVHALIADVLFNFGTIHMINGKISAAVDYNNPPNIPTSRKNELAILNCDLNSPELNRECQVLFRESLVNFITKIQSRKNKKIIEPFLNRWINHREAIGMRNFSEESSDCSGEGLISKESFFHRLAGLIARYPSILPCLKAIMDEDLFKVAVGCALVYPLKSTTMAPIDEIHLRPTNFYTTMCCTLSIDLKSWSQCHVWMSIADKVDRDLNYYISYARMFFGAKRKTKYHLINYKHYSMVESPYTYFI